MSLLLCDADLYRIMLAAPQPLQQQVATVPLDIMPVDTSYFDQDPFHGMTTVTEGAVCELESDCTHHVATPVSVATHQHHHRGSSSESDGSLEDMLISEIIPQLSATHESSFPTPENSPGPMSTSRASHA